MPPRVGVAVSGGRDSLALLYATAAAARPLGVEVHALHVHHGLQPQADGWAALVAQHCARLQLVCHVERLPGAPARGDSVEAWARRGRYRALGAMASAAGIGLVLLAHHRRDQAETFVLQALRGGGAAGLAAMPAQALRGGLLFARPWLSQPRARIEAYLAAQALAAADDPSNGDPRFARSRLRRQVMPALQAAFPDAEAALAASATQAALAQAAIDEWAAADLAACADGDDLMHAPWQRLSPARRHFVLRAWLGRRLGRGAPLALLRRLEAEWRETGSGRWPAPGGGCVCSHRGRLDLVPGLSGQVASVEIAAVTLAVGAPGTYPVAPWRGVLQVRSAPDAGVPLPLLAGLRLAPRAGGERFQAGPGRPPRSLKQQYQAAGLPAWAREGPLVWAGTRLVYVPGLGLDARVCVAQADAHGVPLVTLAWQPLAGLGGDAADAEGDPVAGR